MIRRRECALSVVIVGVAIALLLPGRRNVWQAVYPYLPRRAQAAPYLLWQMLPLGRATPIALPTAVDAPGAPSPPCPTAATDTVATGPLDEAGAAVPSSTTDEALRAATQIFPATVTPPVVPMPIPPAARLEGLRHEYQTWNNCAPATISMALSYFGVMDGQAQAARFLKPDPDDKNVGPDELATYARLRGFGAVVRIGGDLDRLRALLAADVPVVVETWFIPEPGDEMGHYRVLVGYSDAEQRFTAFDSYNGPEVTLDYEEFDGLWRVFNRTYVPVYRPDQTAAVQAALGDHLDDRVMFAAAAVRANAEIQGGEDAFGWFDLGSSLLGLGDAKAAATAYDRARALGLPWRMLWYQFGPFEAYAAEGRWEDVAALADVNLLNASNLEESQYWRGRAMAAAGDTDGARSAWLAALRLNPNFTPAAEALDGME